MTLQVHWPADRPARCGLLLLPGAHMSAQDFVSEGLIAAAAQQRPEMDVITVDATWDEVASGEAGHRLLAETWPQLRARYSRCYLGGISLGAWLALFLALRLQAQAAVAGLCLISPYPGSRPTLNAINRAGGLAAWEMTPAQAVDPEFELWNGLRQQGAAATPTFVAYGAADRFADGQAQLAAALPGAHCAVLPGGHDWPLWRNAWQRWLTWSGEVA